MEKKNDLELKKLEILNEIKYQFDVIIALLAQEILNPDEIRETISKGRKDPKKIIDAFNSCDGKTSLSDVANKYKIDRGNFSRDVESWEKSGYMVKIEKKGKVFPKVIIILK
jgi:Fic family protein